MSLRNSYSPREPSKQRAEASHVHVWEKDVHAEQRAGTQAPNQQCVWCAGRGRHRETQSLGLEHSKEAEMGTEWVGS